MISMMNVQKDLLKFATLDRASFISSASWVRGLIIIGLNWLFGNSKLAIIKNLSKFFKHYFRPHLQCGCSEYQHLQCAYIYIQLNPHWQELNCISALVVIAFVGFLRFMIG